MLTVREFPTTIEVGEYVPLFRIGAAPWRPTVKAPTTVGLEAVLPPVSTAVITRS